jgi:hypothetical protein
VELRHVAQRLLRLGRGLLVRLHLLPQTCANLPRNHRLT